MLQDGTFVDPSTSTKIFSFGTLGLVTSGPAISLGQVIFGVTDGNVYCLSLNGQ
jgi:outer membrane protein assembly factor BamB